MQADNFGVEGLVLLGDVLDRHQNGVVPAVEYRRDVADGGVVHRDGLVEVAGVEDLGVGGAPLRSVHQRHAVADPHKGQRRAHRLGVLDGVDLQGFVFVFAKLYFHGGSLLQMLMQEPFEMRVSNRFRGHLKVVLGPVIWE